MPDNIVQRGISPADAASLNQSNPVVTINLDKIDPSKIVDVSTVEKAKENLKTSFTQNAAAADQEVLIEGDIPPEAIIEYKKRGRRLFFEKGRCIYNTKLSFREKSRYCQ